MYTLSTTDQYSFGDVYILDLARTPTNALAAISSDQSLSLLDPSNLRTGPVTRFSTNHGNLTTLRVFGESVVCTAGESGSVGVWDLRAGVQVVQFDGELVISENVCM